MKKNTAYKLELWLSENLYDSIVKEKGKLQSMDKFLIDLVRRGLKDAKIERLLLQEEVLNEGK